MIFYLTFNDAPSGIYSSQIIDVVKFIRLELNIRIKLVAFISIRGFFKNRKRIKSELNEALVIPMFPGVHRWRHNALLLKLLCFLYRPNTIIARSVLATQLAFKCRLKKIIYDGRGAIAAEWKEYEVVKDPLMLSEISQLEKEAILKSDYRIAVSKQLVKWWEKEYSYAGNNHVIIPCTLNQVFTKIILNEESILQKRKKAGINSDDKLIMYSGSLAGWQSFELVYNFIKPLLNSDVTIKLYFLSEKDPNIFRLENEFPNRIICKKVNPEQVPEHLIMGDYALLVREQSITNQVASPVKFAEYLSCGLPVIISENLGDYTEFVIKNKCGYLLNTPNILTQNKTDKLWLRELALNKFSKHNYLSEYKKILEI